MNAWKSYRAKMTAELSQILGTSEDDLPPVFRAKWPKALKIGIHQDLIARFPEADPERIVDWLGRWTTTPPYFARLIHGKNRHDLDGRDAQKISKGHRIWAKKQRAAVLAERDAAG